MKYLLVLALVAIVLQVMILVQLSDQGNRTQADIARTAVKGQLSKLQTVLCAR